MEDNKPKTIIIVGAGLVGALCACFLGKRGHKIELYEQREDIRKATLYQGRSINLALSNRGRKALREVGLEEKILKEAVPMIGRRLHFLNGKQKSNRYDSFTNQCIYSIGRNFLNKTLLSALDDIPNVSMYFGYKLIDLNMKKEELIFFNTSTKNVLQVRGGDLIIGADGAFSCLRKCLLSIPLFDCSQSYIDHGYIELRILPKEGKLMESNHLHIWPRGNLMLIALPNKDETWTLTLFMPFEKFDQLKSNNELILQFFQKTFPDLIPLIGKEKLVVDFTNTRPSGLVSIKCNRYDFGSKFLLLGDAAHAIVPFYGQGMNAGFEDCTILNQLLNKHLDDFQKTLKEFSKIRVKDAHAVSDLAMYNYEEMRELVTKSSYYLKNWLDKKLHLILNENWLPLYNSVTFTHMSYSLCLKNKNQQDKVLIRLFFMFFITTMLFLIMIILYFYKCIF